VIPDANTCTEFELRVLLLVPTKKDGEVTTRLLESGGLKSLVCESIAALIDAVAEGAGAILTTEEVIEASKVAPLVGALEDQEEWSDIPLVALMRGGVDSPRAVEVFRRLTNVTILERPAPVRSVLSAVQTAVRGRKRQYQIRAQIKAIRLAEESARHADRAKDDFLAALSHELRTPLSPVLLVATNAAVDGRLSAKVREDFELIAKNVMLEARLIDDLLDLTRITRGKLRLEMAPHELAGIVRDAIQNVQPDLSQKRLTIQTDFSDAGAFVNCDPVRLQQVFWNILKNAAKFTPEGGRLELRTFRRPHSSLVSVEVRDSGVGMTTLELARVFDAFAQGDHAHDGRSHKFGGLGLGLAISRSLVALHAGIISAASEGLGQGSVFSVELPIAAAPRAAATAAGLRSPLRRAPPGRSLRILLVEDHEATRRVLTHLLTSRAHRVHSAGSLAEARALGAAHDFDVLVTDIGLPDGTGYDLMEELRNAKGVRGVALTGFGMEDDFERSQRAGFDAHLIKPVQVSTLESTLERLRALVAEGADRPVV
jgi:signal transduction histidine kinase/ActR/RegA family two-component response regulator